MSAAAEAPFVYSFAGLLVTGSVVLLFIPLLLHVRLYLASRAVLAVVIGALLAVGAGAVLLVTYAVSSPADFIPVAAVTAGPPPPSPPLFFPGGLKMVETNPGGAGSLAPGARGVVGSI